MPGGKQRTQNYKQRERNENANIEEHDHITDTEKAGFGARGGDGSQISGQSGMRYRGDTKPEKVNKPEKTPNDA